MDALGENRYSSNSVKFTYSDDDFSKNPFIVKMKKSITKDNPFCQIS